MDVGFRKRSCSNNNLERDDDSKESHPALAGDEVEEGADLRELDRIVQRQQCHVGADREPFGLGRDPQQERQRALFPALVNSPLERHANEALIRNAGGLGTFSDLFK